MVPVDNSRSIIIRHSKNDVSRIILFIYMRVSSPNGSATIGMYAIRPKNTSANEYQPKKNNEEQSVTQTQGDYESFLYIRLSDQADPFRRISTS